MGMTKVTKRKRKQPDWLVNDALAILDLTEDGDEPKSGSVSGYNSSEDGKRSPAKMEGSSFDREALLGDQEADNLQSSSSAKDSPVTKDTGAEIQRPTNTELEDDIHKNTFEVVLPVESIQPPTKINSLYLRFSAQAVEVRGGDDKGSLLIHEWPLLNIVRIGIHYLSEEEEDTRAFVAVTVLVPLSSLSGSSKEIDEYLLQLSKLRDSVIDISNLSPAFGSLIDEELKKEDVEKTVRTIRMQYPPASTSLLSSSSEEPNTAIDAFKVLVYPQGDPDAVTITQKDINILKPFEFLNDTIIDFYIKFLQQTIVSSEKSKTLHFFNSFFFSKLAEVGGAAAFERVKKWTRKVNVFEKDFVFIPVNHSLHWSLIIICHPGNMWQVPTVIDGSSDGDACILHLDSMEGCHRGVDSHIRNYLFQEWIERNKDPEEAPYAEEFFSEIPYRYSKVPQQDNHCDCGLFLLHYVELFLKTAPSVYRTKRQRSPPNQFLRRNWFKPSDASAKRRVIQKLILELSSQGRSPESPGKYRKMKENLPNELSPADEEPTRALSMSLCGDKQSAAQLTDKLDTVPSNSFCHVKESLIENCSSARSEAMELHVDLPGFSNHGRKDDHVKLRHVDGCREDTECDDLRRGMHHISSDQPKASCQSGADRLTAYISVLNDTLKSGPDSVRPDDETWDHERCPVPRLSIRVKPLQVPTPLFQNETMEMLSRPSPTAHLGIQGGSETSDDLSFPYFNEDARRSEEERLLLDFNSILSPDHGNEFVRTASNNDMYERSSFDAKQRLFTSHLQPEVSPVVVTSEHVRFPLVRSPESIDGNFKEEGRTVKSGTRPAAFRNNTSPFGRCSESNMQSALNCGQRKQLEGRNRKPKASHQLYGTSVYSEEIQELEELSSGDSLASLKRFNFEKLSSERTAKWSAIELEPRVTRSKTQSSQELLLGTEGQVKKATQDTLLRQKNSRR